MQYSIVFLAALAASASAAPWGTWNHQHAPKDTSIRVVLQNQATELGATTLFGGDETKRQELPPSGSTGPFQTVTIQLGKDIQNKDLRCQVVDTNGQPLLATRGQNLDTTFSDADKGAWTFKDQTKTVSKVICDPAFKANNQNPNAPAAPAPSAGAVDNNILVKLINEGTETTIPVSGFSATARVEQPFNSQEVFTSIQIEAAQSADAEIRCQILDQRGVAITGKRGANIDTTFSDAGKGPWAFVKPTSSVVSKVICDPVFKSANPAPAASPSPTPAA